MPPYPSGAGTGCSGSNEPIPAARSLRSAPHRSCTRRLARGRPCSRWRPHLREVSLRIDPPATRDVLESLVEMPAVGTIIAAVIGARALKSHAAGVVADHADLRDLLASQPDIGRQ